MSQCSDCGTQFSCAIADPGDGTPCWCTRLPPLSAAAIAAVADTSGALCLCPACLATVIERADGGSPGA